MSSPTRVTATSSTAIDNVITNVPTAKVSVIDTAISDHFAQEVAIGGGRPDLEPLTQQLKRDLQPRNVELFCQAPADEFAR